MSISIKAVKELRERTSLGMMDCKKALEETKGDIEKAIEYLRKNSSLKSAKKANRQATEGILLFKSTADNKFGFILEINSETDFVSRDANFIKFANEVANYVLTNKLTSIDSLKEDNYIVARTNEIIQKIDEKIVVRKLFALNSTNFIFGYVHTNSKLATIVEISSADEQLGKDIAMHIVAMNPMFLQKKDVTEDVINKEKEVYLEQAKSSGKPQSIIDKMIEGRVSKYLTEIILLEQNFVKDPDLTVGKLLKSKGIELKFFNRFELGADLEKKTENFATEVMAQISNQ